MERTSDKLTITRAAHPSRRRAFSLDPTTLKMASLKMKGTNALDWTGFQRTRKNFKFRSLNPESSRKAGRTDNRSLSVTPSRESHRSVTSRKNSVNHAHTFSESIKKAEASRAGYRKVSLPKRWIKEFEKQEVSDLLIYSEFSI